MALMNAGGEGVVGEEVSDWTWSIIDRADRDREKLRPLLRELSEEEVCRFHKEFLLARSVLTGAPFESILCGEFDMSEDGIEDLASWVVGQGRGFYEGILKSPRTLLSHVQGRGRALMGQVISEVFTEKSGKSLAEIDSAWP